VFFGFNNRLCFFRPPKVIDYVNDLMSGGMVANVTVDAIGGKTFHAWLHQGADSRGWGDSFIRLIFLSRRSNSGRVDLRHAGAEVLPLVVASIHY
jgi:hypothetical protein